MSLQNIMLKPQNHIQGSDQHFVRGTALIQLKEEKEAHEFWKKKPNECIC